MEALGEWVNVVEESFNRSCALEMEEFHRLLGFHLYFQSPRAHDIDLGQEMGFVNHEGRVLCASSAVRS